MLPNALFKPLNLQHLIEETERAYGAHGLVDLLVAALTDRRIKRDDDIDWAGEKSQSVYEIRDFIEFKTTWHPIGA